MASKQFICIAVLLIPTLALTQIPEASSKETADLDLDEAWGSDTFSSSATHVKEPIQSAATDGAASATEEAGSVKMAATNPRQMRSIKEALKEVQLKDLWLEFGFLAFMALYLANMYRGAQINKRMAYAWAKEFATEGSILDRNFSHVGISDSEGTEVTILKEGAAKYQCYASGRRFCSSALITLDLRPRMELFQGHILNLLLPQDDILDFEIHMNEAAMPKTVLCVATTRLAREMLRREDCYEDLRLYTRKVEVAKDRLPSWPHDKLTVLAEQPSIFYDLMNEAMMEQVFGRAAFEEYGQYFRAMRLTSEGEGKHKQIAQFSFALPPPDEMDKLSRWIMAAMVFIDLLGNYKMKPDQKAKAEKARQEAATQEHSKEEEVLEREEKLRAKKKEEEQEKLKRMSPAEREKYKARKEKLDRERRARRMGKGMVIRS
ncbi:g8498 [Coccomyxa elongata]